MDLGTIIGVATKWQLRSTTKVPIYIDIDEGCANRASAAHSISRHEEERARDTDLRSSTMPWKFAFKNAPLCTSQLRKGFPEFPEPADQGCGVIPLSDAPRGCKKGDVGGEKLFQS
ncbi:predicted protein [Histoplasma capsulatum H143]|uniref:Uncharacterized protein n=1 Tax=Ajellomyces capsulatus (strain H143) TaxID=544712 RepID=C6HTC7_AJECH|nr:predicted protein [Histoplasma capsulatum H143]